MGIGHAARRGKNSAANAIIEAHPEFNIKSFGFADLLKKEVNDAAIACGGMFAFFQHAQIRGLLLPNGQRTGLPLWVTYDPDAPMDDPLCPLGKQRKLLQWWGTEYRRVAWNKFYWVKAMKETLERNNPQVALITDMRFFNEFYWIKANGGFTIRINRTGYHDADTNTEHPSEHELDNAPYDFILTIPEGGLDELKSDAVSVFETIVKDLEPREVALDVAA